MHVGHSGCMAAMEEDEMSVYGWLTVLAGVVVLAGTLNNWINKYYANKDEERKFREAFGYQEKASVTPKTRAN